jgi:hypothetical protein
MTMLPEIPDNDTETCWALNCREPAGDKSGTGLCFSHYLAVRPYVTGQYAVTGRVFDLLGMRLNVYQETGGTCTLEPGPCTQTICRMHMLDGIPSVTGRQHQQDLDEPCAMKIAQDERLTLKQVGDRLGITRERARQIETAALSKLERAAEQGKIDAQPSGKRRRAA